MAGKQQVDPQQQLKVFKALADPVRLKIVHYLKQLDHEVACGEVQQAIQISKTSGTYHFKLLQNAGLITARKEAREKYVQLNPVVFQIYVTDFFLRIGNDSNVVKWCRNGITFFIMAFACQPLTGMVW